MPICMPDNQKFLTKRSEVEEPREKEKKKPAMQIFYHSLSKEIQEPRIYYVEWEKRPKCQAKEGIPVAQELTGKKKIDASIHTWAPDKQIMQFSKKNAL